MTSFTGYIQGITSGEKRTVDKQGKMVSVSAFENIDNLIVFNEAGETSQTQLIGFNIFDEDTETGSINTSTGNNTPDNERIRSKNYISINPNTVYYCTSLNNYNVRIFYYDSNKNFLEVSQYWIKNTTFTSIANAYYIRIVELNSTYEDDICINISNPSYNGQYEEYCGGVPSPNPDYPQAVEGIGFLYHGSYAVAIDYDDGDEHYGRILATGLAYPLYEGDILDFANSKVIRKNGVKDLGTLTWEYIQGVHNYFRGSIINQNFIANCLNIYCTIYIPKIGAQVGSNNYSIGINGNAQYVYVRDDTFTDAPTFKTAMSGIPLVYELANPVEEYITMEGGDITDIGTAIVTADGTLTIKYDKAKMAIQKYRNPPEWSDIGYDSTPAEIITAFNYAKNLQDSWTGVRNFYGVKELYFFPNVNMKESRSYNGMFQNTNLMHVPPITFGETTVTGNANANDMFRNTYVEDVSLTAVNSTQKFEMQRTFYECFLLKSVTLNLKTFGNINTMFYNCKKLTSVSGEFDTSEVTEVKETFRGCNALRIAPSWDTSSCTSFWRTFTDCTSLTTAPNWNLRNATDLSQMFWGCTALRIVPPYYIPSATNLSGMFQGIGSDLEAGSQNNILQMCANATSYTGTKTLAQLGFNSSMYTASSWQGLSKYADFIDAGWTIGYS